MNEHVTLGMMVQTAVVQSKLLRTIKSFLLLFFTEFASVCVCIGFAISECKDHIKQPDCGKCS